MAKRVRSCPGVSARINLRRRGEIPMRRRSMSAALGQKPSVNSEVDRPAVVLRRLTELAYPRRLSASHTAAGRQGALPIVDAPAVQIQQAQTSEVALALRAPSTVLIVVDAELALGAW